MTSSAASPCGKPTSLSFATIWSARRNGDRRVHVLSPGFASYFVHPDDAATAVAVGLTQTTPPRPEPCAKIDKLDPAGAG
jgi:hypothetical protein